MPIVVQHQPDANLVGRAAYLAGQGQYQQYLDQMAMQAAQMQQRERMANQQMAFQAWQQQQDNARWQQAQQLADQRAMFDAQAQFAGLQQRQAFDANQAQVQRDWQADQYEQLRQANFAERQLGVDAQEDRYFMDWARKAPATLNTAGRTKFQQEMMAFQNIEKDRVSGNLADPQSYAAARKAVRDRVSGMDWSQFEGPDENQLQQEFEKTVVRNSTRFGAGVPVQIVTGRGGKLTEIPLAPVQQGGMWHMPNEGRDGVITMPDAVYQRWLSGQVDIEGKPLAKDTGEGEAGVQAKAQEAARAAQAKLVESVISHTMKSGGEYGLTQQDPAAIMQHYNSVHAAMGLPAPFPNVQQRPIMPTTQPPAPGQMPPTMSGAMTPRASQQQPQMHPLMQAGLMASSPSVAAAKWAFGAGQQSELARRQAAAAQQTQAVQQSIAAAPPRIQPLAQQTFQTGQALQSVAPQVASAAQFVTQIITKYGTDDIAAIQSAAPPEEFQQLMAAMQVVREEKTRSAAMIAPSRQMPRAPSRFEPVFAQ